MQTGKCCDEQFSIRKFSAISHTQSNDTYASGAPNRNYIRCSHVTRAEKKTFHFLPIFTFGLHPSGSIFAFECWTHSHTYGGPVSSTCTHTLTQALSYVPFYSNNCRQEFTHDKQLSANVLWRAANRLGTFGWLNANYFFFVVLSRPYSNRFRYFAGNCLLLVDRAGGCFEFICNFLVFDNVI